MCAWVCVCVWEGSLGWRWGCSFDKLPVSPMQGQHAERQPIILHSHLQTIWIYQLGWHEWLWTVGRKCLNHLDRTLADTWRTCQLHAGSLRVPQSWTRNLLAVRLDPHSLHWPPPFYLQLLPTLLRQNWWRMKNLCPFKHHSFTFRLFPFVVDDVQATCAKAANESRRTRACQTHFKLRTVRNKEAL